MVFPVHHIPVSSILAKAFTHRQDQADLLLEQDTLHLGLHAVTCALLSVLCSPSCRDMLSCQIADLYALNAEGIEDTALDELPPSGKLP